MAPIDLFDPALASQRQSTNTSDVVGRFRSGYQINGQPASLTEWRVTSGDPDVAKAVKDLLGGDKPQEWETKGEDNIEVFTKAGEVDIVIANAEAIDARMLIWPRGQKRIVVCDGSVFDTDGRPYECEVGGFRNKKEHDAQDHLCEPRVSITFRLAEAPELGLFKFESGAWSLATNIARPLGQIGDRTDVKCKLSLEQVEMRNGNTFTKPVLTVEGK